MSNQNDEAANTSNQTFILEQRDFFQYEPEGRRDPFVSLFLIDMENKGLEGIESMRIDELVLVGILSWGDQGQIALFRGTDNKVYQLVVGDRVFDGVIVDITNKLVQFKQHVFGLGGIEKPPRTIIRALRNS